MTAGPRGTKGKASRSPLSPQPQGAESQQDPGRPGTPPLFPMPLLFLAAPEVRETAALPRCTSLGITRLFLTQRNLRRARRKPATLPARGRRQAPVHPKAGREGAVSLLARQQARQRCSLPTKHTPHDNRLLYHAFNTNLKKSGTIETVQI